MFFSSVKNMRFLSRTLNRRSKAVARCNRFSLLASLMACAGTRRNAVRCRSFFVIRRTDLSLLLSLAAIWRLLECWPVSSSCEQISSSTAAMFASERADFDPPPLRSVADPVRSTRWQIFFAVLRAQPLSGYAAFTLHYINKFV